MSSKIIWLVCFIGICTTFSSAQSSYKGSARKYYKKELYKASCDIYKSKLGPKNGREKTLLRAADACFRCGDYEASERFIGQITESKKRYDDEFWFQKAKLAHLNGSFELSANLLKDFLKSVGRRHDLRSEAKQWLLWNWTAMRAMHKTKSAIAQNAGRRINTSYNDRFPVPSPSVEGRYYFSRADTLSTGGRRNEKGKKKKKYGFYRYDIYTADLVNGKWSDIGDIHPFFNSTSHDHIVDISEDGQIMYYFKGLSLEEGSVLTDTFVLDRLLESKKGIMTDEFGYDFDIFQQRIVIFSKAMEDEGYGGRDLYISAQIDGQWSNPKNLGPQVNGPGDEVNPFLANNGRVLYFSTNDARSMGGFDVLKSTFSLTEENWSKPENLGRGVNSTGDDLDFRLSADGKLGVLSSKRSGGKGGYDLYVAYLNEQAYEQLETAYAYDMSRWVGGQVKSQPTSEVVDDPGVVSKPEEPNYTKEESAGYIITPVVFEDEEFLRKTSTTSSIHSLIRILNDAPHAQLVIEGHLSSFQDESRNVFFSAQYAMQVKDAIVEKGISEGRIVVKGFGSKRPIVQTPPQGGLLRNWNNRLGFRVIQSPLDEPIKLTYEGVEVPSQLERVPRRDMFTGLNYRVLIEQSEQILDNPDIIRLNNLIIEQRGKSVFQYMLEEVDTYEAAKRWKAELIERKLTVPRIIPYIGDEPIPAEQLLQMSLKYPDLKEYNRDQ